MGSLGLVVIGLAFARPAEPAGEEKFMVRPASRTIEGRFGKWHRQANGVYGWYLKSKKIDTCSRYRPVEDFERRIVYQLWACEAMGSLGLVVIGLAFARPAEPEWLCEFCRPSPNPVLS